MPKKGHTTRWPPEIEKEVEKSIQKKQFKNKTELVVAGIKLILKIKK